MSEFKLPPGTFPASRHDARIMLRVLMAALALAFGILLFMGYGRRPVVHRFGPLLVWALILAAVCIATIPFVMVGRLRQDLTFVLDEGELIRKKPGFPDVRIPLPQIQFLYEQSGCLVVAGGDPPLRVTVPPK